MALSDLPNLELPLTTEAVLEAERLYDAYIEEQAFNLSGAAYNGYRFDATSKWSYWLLHHGKGLLAAANLEHGPECDDCGARPGERHAEHMHVMAEVARDDRAAEARARIQYPEAPEMSSIEGHVDTPTYEPTIGGIATVRRFMSEVSHLAVVDALAFVPTKWVGPPYWALHDPVVALCGSVLRPDHRGIIAMRESREVCRYCARQDPRIRSDSHSLEQP